MIIVLCPPSNCSRLHYNNCPPYYQWNFQNSNSYVTGSVYRTSQWFSNITVLLTVWCLSFKSICIQGFLEAGLMNIFLLSFFYGKNYTFIRYFISMIIIPYDLWRIIVKFTYFYSIFCATCNHLTMIVLDIIKSNIIIRVLELKWFLNVIYWNLLSHAQLNSIVPKYDIMERTMQ